MMPVADWLGEDHLLPLGKPAHLISAPAAQPKIRAGLFQDRPWSRASQGNGLGRWRDRPCVAHRASAAVLPLNGRGAPCAVLSLRRLAAAPMASVAPVQVQEDPFAVMEACRKAIEEVLKRSVAEGRFIPRGWIDVTYGEEEMALLEEEVLPVLAGVLQRVEEIDAKVRRYRRLIQAEG